jgi:hypothetical protein
MFPRNLGVVAILLMTVTCARTPGPPGYLEPAEVEQRDAYGTWIDVHYEDNRTELSGEFIAVEPDTVFVLTRSGLRAIPRTMIKAARLGTYDSEWYKLAYWTTGGAFLTVSHGWYAAISAPVWIVTGIIAAASVSNGPIEEVNGNNDFRWQEVSKFARFPQGMPPGIDRTVLTLPQPRRH